MEEPILDTTLEEPIDPDVLPSGMMLCGGKYRIKKKIAQGGFGIAHNVDGVAVAPEKVCRAPRLKRKERLRRLIGRIQPERRMDVVILPRLRKPGTRTAQHLDENARH